MFTIVVTGVYGWAIERIAYRPLRNSTRLAPLISAIGMSLILQNYVQLSGPNQQDPDAAGGALRMTVGDGVVQITDQGVYSRRGAGGDAYPDGLFSIPGWAHLPRHPAGPAHGGDPWHHRPGDLPVFVIGAAMAGLAGVLVTMNYGTFDFYIGFIIGIKAFTAAVLGGSARCRAMLGGLLLGWPKPSSPGW